MNIGQIKLQSIIYGVCVFTVTLRYSVGQFVIQIVNCMNIGQIKLQSIIYGVCVFTVTLRYSVCQFVIQILKVVI